MDNQSTITPSISLPQCKYNEYLIVGDMSGDICFYIESIPHHQLRGHTSQVLHLFCIENTLFSSSTDCRIIIWDLNESIEKNRIYFNSPIIHFTLSQNILTVVSKDHWANYELSELIQKRAFPRNIGTNFLCVNTTGNFLLGGNDNKEVYVWDLNICELIKIIEVKGDDCIPLDYGESGLILMGRRKIYTIRNDGKIAHEIVTQNGFYDAAVAPNQSFIVYCKRSDTYFYMNISTCTAHVYSFQNSEYLPLQIYCPSYCCSISSDSKYIAVGTDEDFSLFTPYEEIPFLAIPTASRVTCVDFEKTTNNILVSTEQDLQIWTTSEEILLYIDLLLAHPPKWVRFCDRQVCLSTSHNELVVFDVKSEKNISNSIMLKSVWGVACLDKDRSTMVSKVDNSLTFNSSWKKQGNSKKFYLLLISQKGFRLR